MIFQTTLIWVTIFDEFNARDIIDTYRQTTKADIYIRLRLHEPSDIMALSQ